MITNYSNDQIRFDHSSVYVNMKMRSIFRDGNGHTKHPSSF